MVLYNLLTLYQQGYPQVMEGVSSLVPRQQLLGYVREKAKTGMSVEQIASDYADNYTISFNHAKKVMEGEDYQEAIEAGRQSGLGRIWEKLHHLAIEKDDLGILLLLAKEQLKIFNTVEKEDPMVKSSLSPDKLKKIHELLFTK